MRPEAGSALDRLADNVEELLGTHSSPGLLARLLAADSHLVSGATDSGGRRMPPGSGLPLRADLLDLEREIALDALEWNAYLGGQARRVVDAVAQLPTLAGQLDPNDPRLHGRNGRSQRWAVGCGAVR